jgi:hypothetical protein
MGTVIACLLPERWRHSSELILRRSPDGQLLGESAAYAHLVVTVGTAKSRLERCWASATGHRTLTQATDSGPGT